MSIGFAVRSTRPLNSGCRSAPYAACRNSRRGGAGSQDGSNPGRTTRRQVMDITSLIAQLLGGVAGGNAAGKGLPNLDLGVFGNTIAGALGGIGGGQLLQALIPALAGASGGGLDVGSIVGQLVGGGASGAILTAIVGLVKNMMSGA